MRIKKLAVSFLTGVLFLTGFQTTWAEGEGTTGGSMDMEGQLDCEPYPMIETGYSDGVEQGTIRYVQQNEGDSAGACLYSAYWYPYANGISECYSAAISMALSYIGVNMTAGAIVSEGRLITQAGMEAEHPSFADAMDLYINGAGTYSPPILHIVPYAGRGAGSQHWVVVAGKVSADTYRILDPTNSEHGYMWDAVITGSSISYWESCTDTITEIYQYHLP